MSTPQTHTPDGLFEQGLALHQAGMLEEAIAYYDAVLAAEPAHFDALHLTGVACMQKGQGERAVQLMERAIAINPGVAAPYINLAAALNAMTRFPNAVACCNRALAIEPDSAEAHSNRGNALLALGHGEAALADYDRVVALTPASAEGHFNRGNALLSRLGRLGEAVASFDAAIALRPDYLEAIVNRGSALDKQRRSIDALASFDAAAVAHPNNAEAHANRAKTLNDLQRSEEALAAADHAIGLAPEDAGAHNNRGVALHHMGRQREAIASFELAVTLQPDYVEAYNNIGIALYDLRRPRDGLRQFDRALSLNPNFAIAHMNRATSLLALGELADGFAEYRWRWQVPGAAPQPNLLCAAWEGESLEGKRILVHSEQGFGDTLQFVRFTPALAGMRAEVTLLVPPALVGLLRSLSGAVTERIDETDAFDLHVPMMCLPRLLGTTLDTIPAATPYLAADPEKAARWAERLASDGEGFRVGLVWAGGSRSDQPAAHALDQRRSLSLAQLAPLADVAGVRFFSLQKDGPASQAANPPAGMALADLTDDLHDFSDTAALIANLDLVITVDTSVAHLAGALGKPVWILSRYAGCWRWLNHREDSPWYPTARLFHQPSPGDWESVVTWVAAALAERA